MSPVFNPESRFWRWVDRIGDVLVLSMLWFACSLPVVTLPAASTALYDCAARCVRGGERTPYSRFFRTFRAEFKPAALSGLLWGGPLALLLAGHWLLAGAARTPFEAALAVACYVLAAVPAGALCWLFPLLSRFRYSFWDLNRTALQFWFAHLPSTLAMTALLALAAEFTLQLPILVCFVPCLLALAHSLPVERAFQRHLS